MQTARVGQMGSPKDVRGRGVCIDMLYTHSPPCSLTGRSACRREREWERRAHDARKALMQVSWMQVSWLFWVVHSTCQHLGLPTEMQ